MYDLIALDRPTGGLLRFEELMTALRPCAPDSTPRMRSAVEDTEVVVLASDSRETLESPHARHFASLPALIQRAIDAAGAPAA